MTVEHKNISLAEFKAIEDGPGGFEGYASRFSELDDVGDIVLPGAYKDTLPQFLKMGFTAQSHDWTVQGLIGYPVEAYEDAEGLYIRSEFHSTADAQDVRTKAQERQRAKKQVSLSIGYDPLEVGWIPANDYATELPKYVRPDLLSETLEKAKQFKKVRLLIKNELYEYGIVTAPALRSAAVTNIKGKAAPEAEQHLAEAVEQFKQELTTFSVKGIYEEELAAQGYSLRELWDVFCQVVWKIRDMRRLAEQTGMEFDGQGLLQEALDEFGARITSNVFGDEAGDLYGDMGIGFLGVAPNSSKRMLGDGLPYGEFSSLVVDAVKRYAERTEARLARRTKEGRVLSTANMSELEELENTLADIAARIRKLRENAKPKDKDEDKKQAVIAEAMALLRDCHESVVHVHQLLRS